MDDRKRKGRRGHRVVYRAGKMTGSRTVRGGGAPPHPGMLHDWAVWRALVRTAEG